MNLNDLTPSEFKDFVEDSATLATGAKIYSDGIKYVDNALFWDWITQSYKNSQYLNSSESMKQFINLHSDQLKGITSIIQGKGLEWDVFRDYHPNLINVNKLPVDTNSPIADVFSFDPFSGLNSNIQVKTSLTNSYDVAKELLTKYPDTTQFAVNKSIYDEALKLGIPKERFVMVVSDDNLKSISEDRLKAASKGNVEINISSGGLLNEIGKGALIGAILYVGVSAISNYRKYKSGQMSYNDFANRLLKDGTKGGIMGGSMASVNVGVQWSLVKLGLGAGNPIAIPVLIVISYGLKKIIDPMFKDGSYAETLQTMQYYEDFGKGWLNFGKMSEELYKNQKVFLSTLNQSKKKSEILNTISSKVDDNLNNLIEEI